MIVKKYIEAIRSLIDECDHDISIKMGRYGRLDAIPFERWEKADFKKVQNDFESLERSLSLEMRKAALLYGLPDELRCSLLRPCKKSSPTFTIQRMGVRIPEEYDSKFKGFATPDADLEKHIYGILSLGVHSFMSDILSNGRDAVRTLFYPGDPCIELDTKSRLACGVVREAIILHHFDSLNDFWDCHERLWRIGRNHAYLVYYPDLYIDRELVTETLSEDPGALAMYEVMINLGYDEANLADLKAYSIPGHLLF